MYKANEGAYCGLPFFKGSVKGIIKIKRNAFLAYDTKNKIIIFEIIEKRESSPIALVTVSFNILSLKVFDNGTIILLSNKGNLMITDISRIKQKRFVIFNLCDTITGYASLFLLKDQKHFAFFGEKGNFDFYSYKNERNIKRVKRYEGIYIKYNDSIYEINNKLIIGFQVDNTNTNGITIINLELMKREITIIDDYCMKVIDSIIIQPFYFFQDDDQDSVLCNGPKGITFRLLMKDYSIKHYYKASTFQSPLIISFSFAKIYGNKSITLIYIYLYIK